MSKEKPLTQEEKRAKDFENLSQSMGVDFKLEATVETTKREIVSIESQAEEMDGSPVFTSEDEEYMCGELKTTALTLGDAMETLSSDLKQGGEARKFEVLATLASAHVNTISEFKNIKLAKKKMAMDERKLSSGKNTNPAGVNNGTVNVFHGVSVADLKKLASNGGLNAT